MSVTNFLTIPDAHQEHIFRHFDGRVRYEGQSPIFDKPLVVILFTNRCGSNLFADYLRSTGRIAGLKEMINYSHVISVSKDLGIDSFPEFIASEARFASADEQVFGVKAGSGQLSMLLRCNIHAMFNGIVVFRVIRHNIVDQAVSMVIAEQTGKWTSNVAGKPDACEPVYSFSDILMWVNRFTVENSAGALLGTMIDPSLQTVVYEEFQSNPLPFVKKSIERLGQDASQITLAEPSIRKQANALNQEFRQRFLDEVRAQIQAGMQPAYGL